METVLPEGVLPWMEEAARCLTVTDGGRVRKAEVVTSSGVDIESTLSWPILVRPPG